jgi:hypothetical protein
MGFYDGLYFLIEIVIHPWHYGVVSLEIVPIRNFHDMVK